MLKTRKIIMECKWEKYLYNIKKLNRSIYYYYAPIKLVLHFEQFWSIQSTLINSGPFGPLWSILSTLVHFVLFSPLSPLCLLRSTQSFGSIRSISDHFSPFRSFSSIKSTSIHFGPLWSNSWPSQPMTT